VRTLGDRHTLAAGSRQRPRVAERPRKAPLPVRLVNAYIARLQRAAAHDPKVSVAFIRVIHLVAAPASLFAPRILLRVIVGGGRRRAATDPTVPADQGVQY
jgi:hypothetical protein